jgi:hypothetical protein
MPSRSIDLRSETSDLRKVLIASEASFSVELSMIYLKSFRLWRYGTSTCATSGESSLWISNCGSSLIDHTMKREISVRELSYISRTKVVDWALSAPSYRIYGPVPDHLDSEIKSNMRRGWSTDFFLQNEDLFEFENDSCRCECDASLF